MRGHGGFLSEWDDCDEAEDRCVELFRREVLDPVDPTLPDKTPEYMASKDPNPRLAVVPAGGARVQIGGLGGNQNPVPDGLDPALVPRTAFLFVTLFDFEIRGERTFDYCWTRIADCPDASFIGLSALIPFESCTFVAMDEGDTPPRATPDPIAQPAEPADDGARLPAWRLALPPRKGVILRKTKTTGGSKLGGDPFLPDGVEWPREPSGGEMSFLAQIRCEDLPRDLEFPETGVLFFFFDESDPDYFWSVEDEKTWGAHFRVVYTEGPLPSAPRRRTTPDPAPTPEVFVRAEPVLCRPDDCQKYYDLGRPVHRMLGHPDSFDLTEDAPPPAEDRILLLQLDSDTDSDGTGWCWGDMGMLFFFLSPDDFKARRFENASIEMACY